MTAGETDIIVVGGGGSGLTAAIFAAKAGAKVVLLEKHSEVRGSTGLSIGSITASGTALQGKAGINDSADAHFEDMGRMAEKFSGPERAARDNFVLRRILVDNVADSVAWLTSLGIVMFGPMPEPPHRVPRMHNILPNSRAYIHFLKREAERAGVDIRVNAPVTGLMEDGGRITGVIWDEKGRQQKLGARRAVILASGDYSSSPQWKARFRNDLGNIDGVNTTNTGDGQAMGEALGAVITFGELMYGPNLRFMPPARPSLLQKLPPWPWLTRAMRLSLNRLPSWLLRPFILQFVTTYLSPEPSLFEAGAILVNAQGRRFADERRDPNIAIADQPGKVAWILFDDALAKRFSKWPDFVSTAPGVAYAYIPDYQRTRPDICHRGKTPAELAAAMGVPAAALEAELAAYNANAVADGRKPLLPGTLHALGPVSSRIVLTEGGLSVNAHHQVVRSDGSVIAGLYAVGSAGQGGLLLDGHGHHLAWAFTSGRLGGLHAARIAQSHQREEAHAQ
ncbi:MAG: FAD-dependent oxidoreductase [Notoacmeibacter sp.]|nr:FAD-dependent oxidoreductase [Notoacmeibacter sp.]